MRRRSRVAWLSDTDLEPQGDPELRVTAAGGVELVGLHVRGVPAWLGGDPAMGGDGAMVAIRVVDGEPVTAQLPSEGISFEDGA